MALNVLDTELTFPRTQLKVYSFVSDEQFEFQMISEDTDPSPIKHFSTVW